MIYHKKQSNKLIKLVSLSHDSSLQENNKYYHRKYVTTLYDFLIQRLFRLYTLHPHYSFKNKTLIIKKLKNIITYKIDWKYMYVWFVSESRSYIWYDSWGFLKISQKKEKNQEILRIFSRFSLTNFQIKTLHHILGHRKKNWHKKISKLFQCG